MAEKCLDFERNFVDTFGTPRVFWGQLDQTDTNSYYMKGKSEKANEPIHDLGHLA